MAKGKEEEGRQEIIAISMHYKGKGSAEVTLVPWVTWLPKGFIRGNAKLQPSIGTDPAGATLFLTLDTACALVTTLQEAIERARNE